MQITTLGNTLNELERQAVTADSTGKRIVERRLRNLLKTLGPTTAPQEETVEEDDLLFDNVPL